MVWYADIYFLTEFLIDLTAMLAAVHIVPGDRSKGLRSLLRLLVGAGLGALCDTCLFLLLHKYLVYLLFMAAVVEPVVILLAYRPDTCKKLLCYEACITAILVCSGGTQYAFAQLLPMSYGHPIWYICEAAFCTLFLLLWLAKKRACRYHCEMELLVCGMRFYGQALFDSGNHLQDPYTGQPVSIVTKELIPETIWCSGKIRYIPFHTVESADALMQVQTISEMVICEGGKKRVVTEPVIGRSSVTAFGNQGEKILLNCAYL